MPQGLLAQDVVVLAKLVSYHQARPAIAQLAGDLSLSPSQVHLALKRLERSRLIDGRTGRPLLKAVDEFLIHGVKYVFPARRGEVTRGIPTAYAAPPLAGQIVESGDLPPVWPDPDGDVRGVGFEPLCRAVPKAARRDAVLYELLALIDALRDGRARERQIAERELTARLGG
jgi:DNA-binding transcriptional MocR family regulator